MLEPADQLAAAEDPLPVHIEETETSYAIGWQGRYRIEGQMFICEDRGLHRLAAIQGYSVQRFRRPIDDRESPLAATAPPSNFKYVWLALLHQVH